MTIMVSLNVSSINLSENESGRKGLFSVFVCVTVCVFQDVDFGDNSETGRCLQGLIVIVLTGSPV